MTDDLRDLDNRLKKSAEDFSLTPSPGVWKNVEREIRGDRRSRMVYVFIFVGLLTISSAVAWMLNSPAEDRRIVDTQQESSSALPGEESFTAAVTETNAATDVTSTEHARDASLHTNKKAGADALSIPAVTHDQNRFRRTPADAPNEVKISPPAPENNAALVTEPDSDNREVAVTTNAAESDTDDVKQLDTIHVVKVDSLPAVVPALASNDSIPAIRDSVASSSPGRFVISVGIAPAVSFTEFKEKGDYHFIADYRDSSERNLPVMNFHFDVGYMVSPHMYVYTGLRMTTYRTQMPNRQAVYRYDQTSTGPTPPTVVVSRDYYTINNDANGNVVNKLTYLGIPVGLHLRAYEHKRLSLWLQTEVTTYRLIGSQGYLYDYGTQEYRKMESRDLRSWRLSLATGVSGQYRINDRFAATLSPTIEGFRSIYRSEYSVNQSFGQLSVRMSLRYSF